MYLLILWDSAIWNYSIIYYSGDYPVSVVYWLIMMYTD